MKKNQKFVDKTYKLKRDAAPLSFMLASRHTKRYPLLWFDENTGENRALRYSRNQKSVFEDEQDGNAILEPIIFEDGFLNVPKNNQVLQKFLSLHPQNGIKFEEVNLERDAKEDVEYLNLEVDALIEARALSIDQVENLCRVMFSMNTDKYTTAELKRDILVYAKNDPAGFLTSLRDPGLQLQSKVQQFLDSKLIVFKNKRKDVHFNLKANKKRMVSIPFGEDPLYVISSFLQTDEGIEVLELLEGKLELV